LKQQLKQTFFAQKHLTMSRLVWQKTNLFFLFILSIGFFNCGKKDTAPAQFQLLRKDATGLDFQNVLRPTPEFNALTYMYFYNGGGVAAGDFNNDGLVDLYFSSNMGPNKLFLNEGNLKFKDVTEQAGVAGMDGWTSGVSVVDINNDGLLDIYVSQLGDFLNMKGRNQLYVCQEIKDGVPVFEDEAIPYGLDLVGFGTQTAFFDYDGDGDLDMYQLNHSVHANGTFGQKKTFQGTQHPLSGDKLMRNDGEKFTEVTMTAGINSSVIGYGLGLAMGDLNNDGWPDLYIGNDFHENDYLYINQHDGTFREILSEATMHTSQFSMGVDIADVNNDGWSDLISLDMLPEDPYILKSSLGEDEYGIYHFKLGYGYHPQNARNTLHLNNGTLDAGARKSNVQSTASNIYFSEIGMFAGVHASDWSWASLFMDFDNNGYKDLFVSNGIERRMNDIDYANFRTSDQSEDVKWKSNTNTLEEKDLRVVEKIPQIKLPNKFFRNRGNLTFEDLEKRVKNDLPTFSNGAVHADLDNDGDLDVVVNNIEDEPFIYKNLFRENRFVGGDANKGKSGDAVVGVPANNSYLSFNFKGQPGNIHGIGAKILIFKKNGERKVEEFFPVRGYQSSAHVPLHVGIGDPNSVDSAVVIWPDRTFQRLSDLKFNATQTLEWRAGLPLFDFSILQKKPATPFAFSDATAATGLNFTHVENSFVEFNRERLMPHMVSSEGPALAIGDANGDGLGDVFFGSAKRKKSALFLQKTDGTFYEKTPPNILNDSLFEDVDAIFADLDNDGDQDLVVAAGGNEFRDTSEAMKQRFYLNDGHGNFQRKDFKGVYMTASCVLPADFNGDGLVDFFLGARSLPWNYGLTPPSVLLLNKGNGDFEDVTLKMAKGLRDVGLVKNGTWTDFDGDGDHDLLLAVEWEPLIVFLNNGGHFEKKTLETGRGWWNFVLTHDFDGDGDVDILAGNLGENAKFKPTPEQPVRLYVNDFDDNGQIEQILTYYVKGREIPFANHAEITKQLPILKKKYLYAKDFAKASVAELVGKDKLAKSVLRTADNFKSTYFENTGNLAFRAHRLPDVLQFSTLNAAALADLDGDGKQEVILGGNFYECNIEMGRYDANYGNVLRIGRDGKMEVFPLGDLIVKGQVRRIEPLTINGKQHFVFARNNMEAVVLKSENAPALR
jgi:hypothetical protein